MSNKLRNVFTALKVQHEVLQLRFMGRQFG